MRTFSSRASSARRSSATAPAAFRTASRSADVGWARGAPPVSRLRYDLAGVPASAGAARGLKPNAHAGEVVRGRSFGELIGDIARPVGTALGNVLGGITGALTGTSVSTTNNTAPSWSPNGVFDWQVAFNTSGRNGWIVQEVVNGWRAQGAGGAAVANPFTPHYWEAWSVDAAGAVSPSVGATNDFWTNPDFQASFGAREGHWSTTGHVYFTKTDPATQGFVANNPATNAGILLSTTSEPSGLGIARHHRYAQGTWDSTGATRTHTGSAGP